MLVSRLNTLNPTVEYTAPVHCVTIITSAVVDESINVSYSENQPMHGDSHG